MYERTDGRTAERMNGPANGPTEGRMDNGFKGV